MYAGVGNNKNNHGPMYSGVGNNKNNNEALNPPMYVGVGNNKNNHKGKMLGRFFAYPGTKGVYASVRGGLTNRVRGCGDTSRDVRPCGWWLKRVFAHTCTHQLSRPVRLGRQAGSGETRMGHEPSF